MAEKPDIEPQRAVPKHRKTDTRKSKGVMIGDHGVQININTSPQSSGSSPDTVRSVTKRRISERSAKILVVGAIVIVVAVLIASISVYALRLRDNTSTATVGDNAPYGWGPVRNMYSMREPSPTAAFNGLLDMGNVPFDDGRDFVKCEIANHPEPNLRNVVQVHQHAHVQVAVLVFNASTYSGQAIVGASMKLVLSEEPARNPAVYVYLHGSNVASVWDGCRVGTDLPVVLDYVPGSAQLTTFVPESVTSVQDSVIRGDNLIPGIRGSVDGVIPSDGQWYGVFSFAVSVLYTNTG